MSVCDNRLDAPDALCLIDAGHIHEPSIDGLVGALRGVGLVEDLEGLHKGIGDALILEGATLRTPSVNRSQKSNRMRDPTSKT